MRNFERIKLLSIAAFTAAVGACMHRPMTTTSASGPTPAATSGEYTSGGEVTTTPAGMWFDSTAGWWMDRNGGMRMGGANGRMIGLQRADFAAMNDANIVAHLSAGDSLEVALSQLGADRAQNTAARDFAQRMVTEHTAHMRLARQFAQQANATPMPAPSDTFDLDMANRMMARLSSIPAGPDFDRRFMGAEVMMHRHMLHELTMLQAPATGAARQLVDQTIPVVQQHLTDATAIWHQLGGGAPAR